MSCLLDVANSLQIQQSMVLIFSAFSAADFASILLLQQGLPLFQPQVLRCLQHLALFLLQELVLPWSLPALLLASVRLFSILSSATEAATTACIATFSLLTAANADPQEPALLFIRGIVRCTAASAPSLHADCEVLWLPTNKVACFSTVRFPAAL